MKPLMQACRTLALNGALWVGLKVLGVTRKERWRDKSTAVGWGACGCFISCFCDGLKNRMLAQTSNNLTNSILIAPSLGLLVQSSAPTG